MTENYLLNSYKERKCKKETGVQKRLLELEFIYIDKNTKKMYELSNKIRLINVRDFPISNSDEFLGFICGIISQDHDLEEMFLDSFLTISNTKDDEIDHVIRKLEAISDNFHVNFVLSVSKNSDTLSDDIKDYIVVDL